MSSPIRRNGFGPSVRWLTGIVAYQNLRSVFCCVVSIARCLRIRFHAVRPAKLFQPG